MCMHVCGCADVCDVYLHGLFSVLLSGRGHALEVTRTRRCVQGVISGQTDGGRRSVNRKCQTWKDLLFCSLLPCSYFWLVSVSFGQEETPPCVLYKMACLQKAGQNG